jgi:hypothetical protein
MSPEANGSQCMVSLQSLPIRRQLQLHTYTPASCQTPTHKKNRRSTCDTPSPGSRPPSTEQLPDLLHPSLKPFTTAQPLRPYLLWTGREKSRTLYRWVHDIPGGSGRRRRRRCLVFWYLVGWSGAEGWRKGQEGVMYRFEEEMVYCAEHLWDIRRQKRRLCAFRSTARPTATMSASLIMASTRAMERTIRSFVVVWKP